MLPFLKPKAKETGLTVLERAPAEDAPQEESEQNPGLVQAATDLLAAIAAKDANAVAAALSAAHEICDIYPHEEASHDEGMPIE